MTVPTKGGAQALKLRYLPGDAGWANHVRSLVISGLPVLESVIGSPLKLREDFTMLEVSQDELGGYEGIFQCLDDQLCRIGVVEGAADQVVLHELAHLWTTKYDERWLAEGVAGSARTDYRPDPIWLASRMRWASPPASVAA